MSHLTRLLPSLAAAWLLLLFAEACSNPPPHAPPRWTPPTGAHPLVSSATGGLELHWWIADDSDGAVAQTLAPFASPPLPDDNILRERWTASGLRMVRLPLPDFANLQRSLPALHAWRRRWIGWAPAWTELFLGRRTSTSAATGAAFAIIQGQRRSIPPGALRLLARAWPAPPAAADIGHSNAPTAAPTATIRFELACQVLTDQRANAADIFRQPTIVPEEDRGPIFSGLTLDTTLDPGFIYVITCEAPTVEWTTHPLAPAAPPATSTPRESSAAIDPTQPIDDLLTVALATPRATPPTPPTSPDPRSAPPFEPLGPPVSQPLTLGQAMLSASSQETGSRALRVVLVILPRAARPYRLLP